jgi:hypothetical protein
LPAASILNSFYCETEAHPDTRELSETFTGSEITLLPMRQRKKIVTYLELN